MDKRKRQTLKALTVTVGTVAAGGVAGTAMSSAEITGQTASTYSGELRVSTGISARANEVEVVLTNDSAQAVKITDISPGVARVARGEFDFSALLHDGPLHLEAGSSVSVPMTHKPVTIGKSQPSVSLPLARTLQKSLRVASEVVY